MTVAIPEFERVRNGKRHTVPAYSRRSAGPVWSDEAILNAIRLWAVLFGAPPSICDWNPSMARRRKMPSRIEEYSAGRWPSSATVARRFGKWSNAIRAAGLEPNQSGPIVATDADPVRIDQLRGALSKGASRRILAHHLREVAEAEKRGDTGELSAALWHLAAAAVGWASRL